MPERTVIIVGAGFSGCIVAAQLLRLPSTSPLRVILIDRRGTFGEGVAYGTKAPVHLLNVPAGRMTALPDDDDHFLRYARSQLPEATGGSFLPRLLFARYLDDTLRAAADQAPAGTVLERVHGDVVSVVDGTSVTGATGPRVTLDSGRAIEGDQVVLALGNYPPANPPVGDGAFYTSRRYIADPWAPGALDTVDTSGGVLLVGTGLTMLDVALQLSEASATDRLVALSRRGLIPLPHRPHGAPPSYGHLPPGLIACEPTASAYLRAIRQHARDLERDGVDWREIMASLRPLTPRLWETLPTVERARFLRHARPFWDTHRHRVATDVWQRVDALRRQGRLTLLAARLRRYEESSDAVTAYYRRRGAATDESLVVGTMINCTGPDGDVRRVNDRLLSSLLATGTARADVLGMGLETDDELALVRRDGTVSTSLRLVGPLLKGRYWESTAVPELRVHAARVARSVRATLPR